MDAKNIQALLTEADGFYSAHSEVMNLVCGLAAALKASEERARKAEELAAANLAANKRIVELEQETDGLHDALRTCDESRKELIDGLKTARDTLDLGKRLIQALEHERDAARAELEAERCKGCSNG